jgi:hypothetical protein
MYVLNPGNEFRGHIRVRTGAARHQDRVWDLRPSTLWPVARAKADLADALSSLTKRLEVGHEPEYWPLWVSQLTYAIDSKRLPKSPKDPGFMKASLPLEQLVKDTAARILESFRTSGGKRLILVGALNARVQDLGGNKFSFSLKQRWAFEDVEG